MQVDEVRLLQPHETSQGSSFKERSGMGTPGRAPHMATDPQPRHHSAQLALVGTRNRDVPTALDLISYEACNHTRYAGIWWL